MEAFYLSQCITTELQSNQINMYYDETKKNVNDLQS